MSTMSEKRYKKIPVFIIAFVMFMTVFMAWPAADQGKVYASGETGVVTASSLYVRSGAGTSYSKLGSMKKGKTFTITGTKKDKFGTTWYKLKYNSKTGYVSSKYVDIKSPSVTSVSNLKGTVNTKSSPLTIRKGPGKSYDSLGTLAKGKTFTITGKAKDSAGTWWYQFKFNGKTAYASSSYIKTSSINTSPSVTEVKNTTGTVATKSSPLTIRTGPGTSYSRLGELAKGKTFTVTGTAKDSSGTIWYRLTLNGKTGYASSKYVTIKTTSSSSGNSSSNSGSSATVEKLTDTKVTVATKNDPLIIRSTPSKSGSELGRLKKGTTVDTTERTKDSSGVWWYKITYNGKTGYLSGSYLTVKKTEPPASSEEEENNAPDEEEEELPEPVTFKLGTTTADSGLNVRSGAGTGYSLLTVLAKGTVVTITGSEKASNGKVWYTFQYSSSKTGFICSDYVTVKTVTSSGEFEVYMDEQGFPESYKTGLRALHAAHPQWVFKAADVGYEWDEALAKESKVGVNLVSSSSPKSYRSKEKGAYNSSTGAYTKFDGSWYSAHSDVIAYYMDPRNFLTESGIYQFMTHTYDSSSQNEASVKAVIKGSFMEGKDPAGDYSSYQALINAVGESEGVNPNVLAAMIIQEQGWSGSSLVSGTYSGYKGYYNFFNIGAYTTSTMNAVQRGLWYAKGGDNGSTSYSRPWTTPYTSIKGGAQFYAEGYVDNNQDSYYSKKFNVYNGLSKVATHQYMTNVAGAAGEGGIVKRAYADNDLPVIFEIPVYDDMPSTACQLP